MIASCGRWMRVCRGRGGVVSRGRGLVASRVAVSRGRWVVASRGRGMGRGQGTKLGSRSTLRGCDAMMDVSSGGSFWPWSWTTLGQSIVNFGEKRIFPFSAKLPRKIVQVQGPNHRSAQAPGLDEVEFGGDGFLIIVADPVVLRFFVGVIRLLFFFVFAHVSVLKIIANFVVCRKTSFASVFSRSTSTYRWCSGS